MQPVFVASQAHADCHIQIYVWKTLPLPEKPHTTTATKQTRKNILQISTETSTLSIIYKAVKTAVSTSLCAAPPRKEPRLGDGVSMATGRMQSWGPKSFLAGRGDAVLNPISDTPVCSRL